MQKDFFKRCQPRITLLEEDQKKEIHSASLKILERNGVLVHDTETVELLQNAGCRVTDNKRVYIPGHLVQQAIQTVPQHVTIYNRLGRPAMELEDRKSYFGTGSDTPNVIDFESGRRREAVLEDVRRSAQLAEGLDNIDFVMSMGIAKDVPVKRSDRFHFAEMLRNTTKPIMFTAWDLDGLKEIYSMAVAVAGSEEEFRAKPFIIHYAMNIAPFVHNQGSVQKVLFCAEKGIPVEYHSVDIGGSTAPATLAGAFIQGNARNLSSIVIHQLKCPGAPMSTDASVAFLNMTTMVSPYFSPEVWLASIMSKEMALFYGIPTFAKAGAGDAKILDQQAGIEIGLSIYHEYLVGNNLIHDMGYLESGMTASLESMVICNEVASLVKHIGKGFDFSPYHMALELIEKVGPEGNYLVEDYTLDNFRKTFWFPTVMDHNNYSTWLNKGSKDMKARGHELAKHILDQHEPIPLSKAANNEIDSILAFAE